jgi:hypothetical protein
LVDKQISDAQWREYQAHQNQQKIEKKPIMIITNKIKQPQPDPQPQNQPLLIFFDFLLILIKQISDAQWREYQAHQNQQKIEKN